MNIYDNYVVKKKKVHNVGQTNKQKQVHLTSPQHCIGVNNHLEVLPYVSLFDSLQATSACGLLVGDRMDLLFVLMQYKLQKQLLAEEFPENVERYDI